MLHSPALRDELLAWFNAWSIGFEMLDLPRQRLFLESLGARVLLWRVGERTPRGRLTLELPARISVLPHPLDVAANRAAYGDGAEVDEDGIFVDTTRAAQYLRSPLILEDGLPSATVTTAPTAEDIMQWVADEAGPRVGNAPNVTRTNRCPRKARAAGR